METAIFLPILLVLMSGLLEYGWIFLKSQQITNAARQGARVGATVDASTADIQTAVDAAMQAAGLEGSGYTVTVAPGEVDGLESGTSFTVTVQVSYQDIELGLPLVPTPASLGSSTTMVKEGP